MFGVSAIVFVFSTQFLRQCQDNLAERQHDYSFTIATVEFETGFYTKGAVKFNIKGKRICPLHIEKHKDPHTESFSIQFS